MPEPFGPISVKISPFCAFKFIFLRMYLSPIFLSIITGISLSLYILTWASGIYFIGILSTFVILQYILNHLKGKSNAYITFISTITLISSSLLIIPFVDPLNEFNFLHYSYLHIFVSLGGGLFIGFVGLLSLIYQDKKVDRVYWLIELIGLTG